MTSSSNTSSSITNISNSSSRNSSGGGGGITDRTVVGGTSTVVSAVGSGCCWVASLSRQERLEDLAYFRLKEAAGHVVRVIGFIVEGLQKQKMYQEAVVLLRLLVRHDEVHMLSSPAVERSAANAAAAVAAA